LSIGIPKAFVSSTFEDLKDHRAHVIKALRRAGVFVDPMEDWTAATHEPKNLSLERVKGCQLCVLLVGFRRGHVPVGQSLSITQREYGTAVDDGMDVLVYMLKEEAPWPRQFDELDKDPEIRKWRVQLKEDRTVDDFYLDPGSIEIAPALTRWFSKEYAKLKEELERERKAKLAAELGEAIVRQSPTHRALEAANSSIWLIQSIAAESQPRPK